MREDTLGVSREPCRARAHGRHGCRCDPPNILNRCKRRQNRLSITRQRREERSLLRVASHGFNRRDRRHPVALAMHRRRVGGTLAVRPGLPPHWIHHTRGQFLCVVMPAWNARAVCTSHVTARLNLPAVTASWHTLTRARHSNKNARARNVGCPTDLLLRHPHEANAPPSSCFPQPWLYTLKRHR